MVIRRQKRRGKSNKRPDSRNAAIQQVQRAVADQEVGFLRLWFTDVLGFMKSFAIPVEELERAFRSGVMFDGSAIEGFTRRREQDLLARPDPFTFTILPWGTGPPTAAMFCDVFTPADEPFVSDPRSILRRQLAQWEQLGLQPFVGPEIEFFLFKSEHEAAGLDSGTYFDVTTADISSDFRRTAVRYLEKIGIPVEESHHEVAASQHEIDLRFSDALSMADSVMTFRLLVKEAAREFGAYASFMPKPIRGAWGSGMHLHLTVKEGDGGALGDASGLSPMGRSFVAGILTHARAITAVTNQWVNSYKRLVPGYEAPVHVCWGRSSRAALVRVPAARNGDMGIEVRSPDPACNPYLAIAVVLAAALDGIRSGTELPDEAEDLEDMSDGERLALGIGSLPDNLPDALREMERSELVRSVLGDHVMEWFLRNKLDECAEYASQVTPFEVRRYLPML